MPMKSEWTEIKTAARAVFALAVLLCGIYPTTVWVASQILFPAKANGSLIVRDGAVVGSSLIGQPISEPRYFHPRPSAAGAGYDGLASGGSNLGPLSKTLIDAVARRAASYRLENGLPAGAIVPADAVTASASGLDPHISPANALLQAPRVARSRGLDERDVRARIAAATEGRDLGILGERGVNVLKLNLDLDGVGHAGR